MPEIESSSRLITSLNDVREVEEFFYALIPEVARRKPRKGEDVTGIAQEMGLQVPDCLRGATMTWPGALRPNETELEDTLMLARPARKEKKDLAIIGAWCLDIPITEPIGIFRVCLVCLPIIGCRIVTRTIYPY